MPKARRLHGCQLQTLCLKRSISCRERHGRIRGRFTPVRKWVPARPAKFADQLPNRPTAMVQRLHQPIQTVSISFVPLFRNLGSTPPDGVRIHLFCSGQCWFECLPSRDTLVYTIVRVYTSERTVRETPLAGIEAVALVDEGCVVALASQGLATEDRLPSIAVARPLVQDKNPREVLNISEPSPAARVASSRKSCLDSRSPRTAIPIVCRSGTESWHRQAGFEDLLRVR